jgi:hypothetical protein
MSTCFRCHRRGHWVKQCPFPRPDGEQTPDRAPDGENQASPPQPSAESRKTLRELQTELAENQAQQQLIIEQIIHKKAETMMNQRLRAMAAVMAAAPAEEAE